MLGSICPDYSNLQNFFSSIIQIESEHSVTTDERVLILLPAYNQEATISKSIEAVIKQSHHNWILIIQDDCSSDRTLDIIESYSSADSRIHSFPQVQNVGLSRNWNSLGENGLKSFASSYVCWLAGDDYWAESNYLKDLILAQQLSSGDISSPSFQKVTLENVLMDKPFLVKLTSASRFMRTISLLSWKLNGLYILYSLYSRNHFEKVFFNGGAPSSYPGSDFWWVYTAVLDSKVINVPSATFCKGIIEYDKHNLNPHRSPTNENISRIEYLNSILWAWKLQASLFKHLIVNERHRFKLFSNWTLPIICSGIFLVTLLNIVRFPIDGVIHRLKNIRYNKRKNQK